MEIKKCPKCNSEVTMMFGITRIPSCYALCKTCKSEYDLPGVKVKILNNLKVSKTTLHAVERKWNKIWRNEK